MNFTYLEKNIRKNKSIDIAYSTVYVNKVLKMKQEILYEKVQNEILTRDPLLSSLMPYPLDQTALLHTVFILETTLQQQ